MRKGMLQQADTPQTLYERPVNLFVAGFIGSPAMNLMEARLSGSDRALVVEFGGFHLPIPQEVLADRPALAGFADRPVVLGIRPEDMEDASLVSDAPDERRIRGTVELREALGSDVVVHFTVAAPPALTDDVRELAIDVGEEALQKMEEKVKGGESNVVARLNPRTRAHTGDTIELVVDATRLHFFDPNTGAGIYGQTEG